MPNATGADIAMPYVAAQTGINSFFINYVTETTPLSNATAALYLSFGGMGLFMAGRMGGSWLMARVGAERVLLGCALGATAAMGVLLTGRGAWGISAFFVENDWKALEQARKQLFTTDKHCIKISTIHSFKGWEAPHVIVILERDYLMPNTTYRSMSPQVVYTAITRARESLYIINIGNDLYHDFFYNQA